MLPKKYHLLAAYDFRRVRRLGGGVTTPYFGLSFVPNNQGLLRFGIIVPLKIEKRSVYRHRLKRLINTVIEARLGKMVSGFDIVIVAFQRALLATYEDISNSFDQALSKTPLL